MTSSRRPPGGFSAAAHVALNRQPRHRWPSELCTRCRERYRQGSTGLCRRCARELGDGRTRFEHDRDRLAQQHAAATLTEIERVIDPRPRPTKTIVVEGVEYEVKFDGT